jgi:hypothetical protein
MAARASIMARDGDGSNAVHVGWFAAFNEYTGGGQARVGVRHARRSNEGGTLAAVDSQRRTGVDVGRRVTIVE